MSTSRSGDPLRRRRLPLILIGAAIVVVIVVVVAIALVRGSSTTPRAASTSPTPVRSSSTPATTSPSSTASAVPNDSPTTGGTVAGQAVADARPVGDPAAFGTGATAEVTSVTDVTVDGSGRGDVDGPGIRVAVTFTNGSAAAIDLSTVVVNVYYADAATPASPSTGSAAAPLSGVLEQGASAEGTYLFTVPAAQRSSVVVTVGYSGATPIVTFAR